MVGGGWRGDWLGRICYVVGGGGTGWVEYGTWWVEREAGGTGWVEGGLAG